MPLKETLKSISLEKQRAEEFERDKPAIIADLKIQITGVLDTATAYLQEYIDAGQMQVGKTPIFYQDEFLKCRIETERLEIKAGDRKLFVEPTGVTFRGDIALDLYSKNKGNPMHTILLHPVKKTVFITSRQETGIKNERKVFEKIGFENCIDDILR